MGLMQLMPATAQAVRRQERRSTRPRTSAPASPICASCSTATRTTRSWRSPPTTPAPARSTSTARRVPPYRETQSYVAQINKMAGAADQGRRPRRSTRSPTSSTAARSPSTPTRSRTGRTTSSLLLSLTRSLDRHHIEPLVGRPERFGRQPALPRPTIAAQTSAAGTSAAGPMKRCSANQTMPPAIAPGSALIDQQQPGAAEHDQPLPHRVEPARPLIAERHPRRETAAPPRCESSTARTPAPARRIAIAAPPPIRQADADVRRASRPTGAVATASIDPGDDGDRSRRATAARRARRPPPSPARSSAARGAADPGACRSAAPAAPSTIANADPGEREGAEQRRQRRWRGPSTRAMIVSADRRSTTTRSSARRSTTRSVCIAAFQANAISGRPIGASVQRGRAHRVAIARLFVAGSWLRALGDVGDRVLKRLVAQQHPDRHRRPAPRSAAARLARYGCGHVGEERPRQRDERPEHDRATRRSGRRAPISSSDIAAAPAGSARCMSRAIAAADDRQRGERSRRPAARRRAGSRALPRGRAAPAPA